MKVGVERRVNEAWRYMKMKMKNEKWKRSYLCPLCEKQRHEVLNSDNLKAHAAALLRDGLPLIWSGDQGGAIRCGEDGGLSAACMACELGGDEGRSLDFGVSLWLPKSEGQKWCVYLPSRRRPWVCRSLISVSELIRVFIGCLRTNASREARLVGTRCDQETQTEATMVFLKICGKGSNSGNPKSQILTWH